jgi:putative colanic acid biosynthesis acetyltransferase WcaF
MNKTDLSSFNNSWYKPGGTKIKRIFWYYTNILFFLNPWNPFSSLKKTILKLYGANIGKGFVIKPAVNIKYPWKLKIGDFVWIGENVWIDNLDNVEIGNNVSISQGAVLLCGNHNYKKSTFDLITGKIILEDGVWIGARSIVTPGILCKSHSVLSVNSVATQNLEAYTIYQGNPAVDIRKRNIE